MKFFPSFKPALAMIAVIVLGGGYYWIEHRAPPEPKEAPGEALVVVAKASQACFSDLVRVTGFVVPRREAVVSVDQDGSRVTELLVHEGDLVTENQELARLSPPQPGAPARQGSAPIALRAPAAGLVTEVRTAVGAPASPQAGPMFRIAVNDEIELDAQVPAFHMLKINPGAVVRISHDEAPDLIGHVRLVSPEIDRANQLGHVRVSFNGSPSPLKVGWFARASIDAKRSCGVAVPRTAIDHLTVQVVKANTIETRNVRVGLTSDTSTEILEGLGVGEIVVADAGSSLHDGDRVRTMFAEDLEQMRGR